MYRLDKYRLLIVLLLLAGMAGQLTGYVVPRPPEEVVCGLFCDFDESGEKNEDRHEENKVKELNLNVYELWRLTGGVAIGDRLFFHYNDNRLCGGYFHVITPPPEFS